MRILIVVPDSGVGGVTASAVNFSCELAKRGHEVFCLDMSGEHRWAERLDGRERTVSLSGRSTLWNIRASGIKRAKGIKKITLLLFGCIKKLTIKSGLWYRMIFKPFKEYGTFDVAIAFRQCAPCYSFVLNKVNAKKKMGFVHGDLAHMGDISSWKKYMMDFDKIAYVSNAVKEGFIATYPELERNACTIYNMFNVEQIKKLANEKPVIEFDNSMINIVTVARIEDSQKQICWIPRIARILKDRGAPPFNWFVVGDGPDLHKNLQLAEDLKVNDAVKFVGHANNPFPFVSNANFVVLPTKWEAYPMVVIESFILKKPLISTNYCSVREALTEGCHGYIAEQKVESVAELVLKMIQNDDRMYTRVIEFFENYTYTNCVAYDQFLEAIGENT